ncbi:DUF1161 domain-containing protein [Variovorax humicola]|uniref:DUF1161 domain-containing protein n=1 Tax=Variovorax humicola TaxID=1769758 RepID=A0ABU8W1P2_9BURK
MIRPVAVLALSFAASASSHAITCDALKAEIDQKFRTGGVANFSLTVANAAALLPGRVVGTCDNGNSKILYQAGAPASTGAASRTITGPAVLTECRQGFSGPDCTKRVADR